MIFNQRQIDVKGLLLLVQVKSFDWLPSINRISENLDSLWRINLTGLILFLKKSV